MQLKQGTLLQGGKYRIEKVLGQGGFGITYVATDTRLGRQICVKEFFMKEYCNRDQDTSHVSVASEGAREQVDKYRAKFVKEARLISSMNNLTLSPSLIYSRRMVLHTTLWSTLEEAL